MKYLLIVTLVLTSTILNAQKTIWDQLPKTQAEQFKYFEKIDTRNVFTQYKKMRGTKYIFACINAQIFDLYAFQQDSISSAGEVDALVREKCGELREISLGDRVIKLPLGSPLLLKFENDYQAHEGYLATKDKWTPVAANDQAQIFLYKGKQTRTPEGYISAWVLSNYDKEFTYASLVTLRQFDCKQRRFKISSYIPYEGKYGYGKKLPELEGDSKWALAPPDSMYEALVESVCK
jgi:hypothetical protein